MSTLLYIFWSYPRPGIDPAVYAGRSSTFREELENYMGGQLTAETASFLSPPPPWLATAGQAFSDWWPLPNASVLDNLNEGSQVSEVKPSHDAVAALYGGGAGSLYDWKKGELYDPSFVNFTHWFAKPAGMSYSDLYELLEPALSAGKATLLRRRMVLGPSPEFCLASEALLELMEPIEPLTLQMTRL